MPDKIRDEAHALECLAAATQAGLTPTRWATAHGVHPRSLHGWYIALLTWVFERRGTHAGKYGLSAAELTPMAYKAGLARPSG